MDSAPLFSGKHPWTTLPLSGEAADGASVTRVLLVEDHPMDALLLRELLELAGMDWTLEDVPTFAAAARRWPKGGFDILLLDLNLPDGLGTDLLARALDLASGLPVVVLSGQEDLSLASQATGMGARGYVLKGLEVAEHLRQIVEPSVDTLPGRG